MHNNADVLTLSNAHIYTYIPIYSYTLIYIYMRFCPEAHQSCLENYTRIYEHVCDDWYKIIDMNSTLQKSVVLNHPDSDLVCSYSHT